jgi:hypothetical protein
MRKGPKGARRPADVNAAAALVGRIATGEVADDVRSPESEGKNPAAVALGRMGGKARAANMTKKRRKEIARQAAETRWKNQGTE